MVKRGPLIPFFLFPPPINVYNFPEAPHFSTSYGSPFFSCGFGGLIFPLPFRPRVPFITSSFQAPQAPSLRIKNITRLFMVTGLSLPPSLP